MQKTFKTAVKFDKFMIEIDGELKSRYEHFGEKNPQSKQLEIFGEAGTFKIGKDGKLEDLQAPLMLFSYSCNHHVNCSLVNSPIFPVQK